MQVHTVQRIIYLYLKGYVPVTSFLVLVLPTIFCPKKKWAKRDAIYFINNAHGRIQTYKYALLYLLFVTKNTFNKLDRMTSGKKEDPHNLLALAVSFSLKR